MSASTYNFNDGAAYEDFMGVWSRKVGEQFLDWIAPAPGLRWVDIGCGNGCSTEQLCQRTAPRLVEGIHPSPEQLAHARERLRGLPVNLQQGNAMALPFADDSFDAAQMALVIFFVPDPTKGLAEMARVTRPGGLIAAHAWEVPAGGQPYESVWRAQEDVGLEVVRPPRADVSRADALDALWRAAGLEGVETRRIHVTRDFADFTAFWTTFLRGPLVAQIPPDRMGDLREASRARLGVAEGVPFTVSGFVTAAKGRVPA